MAGRRKGSSARRVRAAEIEDRPLPHGQVLLGLLPRTLGLLEHRQHSLARRPGRAERSALDERLNRLLVHRPSVHSGAEVPQVLERSTLFAGALDRFHGLIADALDRVQPEPDVAIDDDELVLGHIYVRRQDGDPHLLGLGDEERHLVLGVHHRGDQRRHVLSGVVRFEPRGSVGDQRVAGGVRLVEAVVRRTLVGRPKLLDHLLAGPGPPAPFEELGLELGHRLAVLLADRLAQVVGLGAAESGDLLGDLHRLLLVDDHAVGRFENRAQALVGVGDGLGVVLAAGVVGDVLHRPGPVQRVERDQVLEI